MESSQGSEETGGGSPVAREAEEKPVSKNAQKRALKQQRYEVKKAEKKAMEKEQKKKEKERKQIEWEEKLVKAGSEEERQKLVESRRELRKERMEQRSEEKESKLERLKKAKLDGQKIVIDLEFAHLMNSTQLHSLVQQVMYCYAVNGRCKSPAHLLLTGCEGEMQNQLQRLPGYAKWLIDKESQSYIQAVQEDKENLVYLTADSETVLEELDAKKIYIIGGLVDRNRWKGITLNKARDQGIQTAKLPIGSYLEMSSSQVLTVNQVLEILLKYMETRDWKDSFFQVVPQRKNVIALVAKVIMRTWQRKSTGKEMAWGLKGTALKHEDFLYYHLFGVIFMLSLDLCFAFMLFFIGIVNERMGRMPSSIL